MTIEMFVSATLRGSAKGTGKVMYTLRTKQENGKSYEKPPEIGQAESTANRLVLWSICRALERMPSERDIVIYTENSYIASVINQCWPERWSRNGWKNSRGKEIKDADLWKKILEEVREVGHRITAVEGRHEYSNSFSYNMHKIEVKSNIFTKVEFEEVTPVSDRS